MLDIPQPQVYIWNPLPWTITRTYLPVRTSKRRQNPPEFAGMVQLFPQQT